MKVNKNEKHATREDQILKIQKRNEYICTCTFMYVFVKRELLTLTSGLDG